MKVLITEDEDLAVSKLSATLKAVAPDAEIVGRTDSIISTVEWLNSNQHPDVILMDIELADGQSFEIFSRVEVTSHVIFTTSYDEHALKAFKVNAIDYLLKPIQADELQTALGRFRKTNPKPGGDLLNVENLISVLQGQLQTKNYRKRFLVKSMQKLVSVSIEDIAYFYADDKLNFFKTKDNRKFIVEYKMEEIEDMVDPDLFFRISRAYMVSMQSIERIEEYPGHRVLLRLKPANEKDPIVSRERVSEFKSWLGK